MIREDYSQDAFQNKLNRLYDDLAMEIMAVRRNIESSIPPEQAGGS
jgi:hypothetical protein